MTSDDLNQDANTGENVCLVCGVGDDGRPLCHFYPDEECPEEIFLHVFCGKTAAILPHVNRPDLEILTKAGVKNKHGTGVCVTMALQRCRSARINDPSNREQEYYLSHEFERVFSDVSLEQIIPEDDTAEGHGLDTSSSIEGDDHSPVPSLAIPNQIYATTSDIHTNMIGGVASISPDSLDSLHHHYDHDNTDNDYADHPPTKRHKTEQISPNDEKSPYEIEMENLQQICDACGGVGYSLVRGVARNFSKAPLAATSDTNGTGTPTTDNEISEDEDFDPKECSQEQVDHVRVIIITKDRQERMEEMSKLIMGEQNGQSLTALATSFSYQVINAWNSFIIRFQEASDWQKKFDLLFGFTHTLKEFDTWMYDHEEGWGGEKMVEQLAKSWKLMLLRGNDELGIDSEYTRPGVVALLEQFKAAVESVAPQSPKERMLFDFED